jgi:uncharacterized membrane protein
MAVPMTNTDPNQGTAHAPEWLTGAVRTIESEARLDDVADRLQPVADRLNAGRPGEVLRGEHMGHALHPALTDLPIGFWTSAFVLDIVGGRSSRKAAQRLVGMGLLAVPATAASGWADWGTMRDDPPARRVGVVHAIGNTVVALCYFRSWRARRKGNYARGKLWGFIGGGLATGTAYLGGHLVFGKSAAQGERGLDEGREVVNLTGDARRGEVPVGEPRY